MAEQSGSLSNTAGRAVVTTVVTAITGAVITWFAGWWPALWAAITAATASVWAFLTYPVSLPLAIVALLAIPFLIRLVRGVRYVVAPPQPAQLVAAPAQAPLSDLEERLMRLLAEADGRLVHFEDAASRLMTSNLLLQKACEALSLRGYIEPNNHIVRGLHISLTREGREFVIEQGFVRS